MTHIRRLKRPWQCNGLRYLLGYTKDRFSEAILCSKWITHHERFEKRKSA